jgi:hypothetical protein
MGVMKTLFRRPDLFWGMALATLVLVVYLRTLCPTIYWGDCGELATAAYTLGITHPTGYPVWCLLAKAWTLLFPFGTIVWRLNVLSALWGAGAAALVFASARVLAAPRPVAFLAASLFAFSHTFWQQCLFAETYSLTACYTGAVLFLAFRWRVRGCEKRDLSRLALVCGLAMTNGQINTLFLPGVIAFVLWSQPDLLRLRRPDIRAQWLRTVGLGLLPLLFYAYLPLRAMAHPAENWGDPETPYAFFYHVTGRPYASMMFHLPLREVRHNLDRWAHGLGAEYPWLLIGLAVWGLARQWRGKETRPIALLLTWVLVADVGYSINYAIYNQYIYFIPSYLVLALLAGVGLTDIGARLQAALAAPPRLAWQILGMTGLTLLLTAQAAGHWRQNDLHENWSCYDYGRNLLASAPHDSLLIDNGGDDSHAPLLYLQIVERSRPDVVYVSRPMLWSLYDFSARRWANLWYWHQLEQAYPAARALRPRGGFLTSQVWREEILRGVVAQAVAAGRPVAVIRPTHAPVIVDEQSNQVTLNDYLGQHYDTAAVGLLLRVYPHGGRPADAALLAQTRQVWHEYTLRGVYDGLYVNDAYLTPMAIDYADAGMAWGRLAESQGDTAGAAAAYGSVLRLFRSDKASAGLARCTRPRGSSLSVTLAVTP